MGVLKRSITCKITFIFESLLPMREGGAGKCVCGRERGHVFGIVMLPGF